MNRLALQKKGMLPDQFYPYGERSPAYVNRWQKVKNMVRAQEKWGDVPPYLVAPTKRGVRMVASERGRDYNLIGTHRATANQLIRRRGKGKPIPEIPFTHLKSSVRVAGAKGKMFRLNRLDHLRRLYGRAATDLLDHDWKRIYNMAGEKWPERLIRRKYRGRYK